jgi:8-oxo-dGTP pyrophosphatase MutT (NUDIX family)
MATRRFAARVVLLDPANRVLLFNWANRGKGTNWWATPGGGLEEGEKSRDAALRELREEAGIRLPGLQGPLWRTSHFFRSGPHLVLQHETFFLGHATSDEVNTEGFDAFEAEISLGHRWWPIEEIETTSEAIYPRGLGGLVREVLTHGVPPKAIAIKG